MGEPRGIMLHEIKSDRERQIHMIPLTCGIFQNNCNNNKLRGKWVVDRGGEWEKWVKGVKYK